MLVFLCLCSPSGVILEALHTDPANIVALEQGNFSRTHKPSVVSRYSRIPSNIMFLLYSRIQIIFVFLFSFSRFMLICYLLMYILVIFKISHFFTFYSKLIRSLSLHFSPSFTTAKLFKTLNAGSKLQETEKKETPQERLKRIMSKQLNKQSKILNKIPSNFCSNYILCIFYCVCIINLSSMHVCFLYLVKKDSAVETAKKREQERIRREKLAETSRLGRYRQWSRSRSRSPSRWIVRFFLLYFPWWFTKSINRLTVLFASCFCENSSKVNILS